MVREQRDKESFDERETLKKIVGLWKNLRELRERQKFANTNLKILIHKENVNLYDDRNEYEKEIQRQLEDLKEDYEANFEAMNEKYEEDLKVSLMNRLKMHF